MSILSIIWVNWFLVTWGYWTHVILALRKAVEELAGVGPLVVADDLQKVLELEFAGAPLVQLEEELW